jgi:hypothetical protein
LNVGGFGIPGGNNGEACVIAACTSCAAASNSRLNANCNVTDVEPSALTEFIESKPSIVENCRSNGVATAEAIVSGFAPGKLALTTSVGKSTFGKSLTGRNL